MAHRGGLVGPAATNSALKPVVEVLCESRSSLEFQNSATYAEWFTITHWWLSTPSTQTRSAGRLLESHKMRIRSALTESASSRFRRSSGSLVSTWPPVRANDATCASPTSLLPVVPSKAPKRLPVSRSSGGAATPAKTRTN